MMHEIPMLSTRQLLPPIFRLFLFLSFHPVQGAQRVKRAWKVGETDSNEQRDRGVKHRLWECLRLKI